MKERFLGGREKNVLAMVEETNGNGTKIKYKRYTGKKLPLLGSNPNKKVMNGGTPKGRRKKKVSGLGKREEEWEGGGGENQFLRKK